MIIGLLGFQGSGKDTVANYLIEKYGFVEDSFAGPLKQSVSVLFGWPYELLEGKTKESREFREKVDEIWSPLLGKDITPRMILQQFGTEVFRNSFDDAFWIKCMQARMLQRAIYSFSEGMKDVVITDVRFPNEIKFIKNDLKGYIVDIEGRTKPEWYQTWDSQTSGYRNDPEKLKYLQEHFPSFHISETARFSEPYTTDYLVHNTGSLDELHANVDVMIKLFRGPFQGEVKSDNPIDWDKIKPAFNDIIDMENLILHPKEFDIKKELKNEVLENKRKELEFQKNMFKFWKNEDSPDDHPIMRKMNNGETTEEISLDQEFNL